MVLLPPLTSQPTTHRPPHHTPCSTTICHLQTTAAIGPSIPFTRTARPSTPRPFRCFAIGPTPYPKFPTGVFNDDPPPPLSKTVQCQSQRNRHIQLVRPSRLPSLQVSTMSDHPDHLVDGSIPSSSSAVAGKPTNLSTNCIDQRMGVLFNMLKARRICPPPKRSTTASDDGQEMETIRVSSNADLVAEFTYIPPSSCTTAAAPTAQAPNQGNTVPQKKKDKSRDLDSGNAASCASMVSSLRIYSVAPSCSHLFCAPITNARPPPLFCTTFRRPTIRASSLDLVVVAGSPCSTSSLVFVVVAVDAVDVSERGAPRMADREPRDIAL